MRPPYALGVLILLWTLPGCPADKAESCVPETCNGLDDDCDGLVPADELDEDHDGQTDCAGDCDDAEPRARVGGVELCNNGIDDDCDGTIDEACGPGPCDTLVPEGFATVQEAIDAATDGDVICVTAGIYEENLDFGGAEVQVVGVDGASETVIDGGGLGAVVVFASGEGPQTLLQGFTLTNGEADFGGGIHISGASPTLVDLVIEGNSNVWNTDLESPPGGGLYVEDGDPVLAHVILRENYASQSEHCKYASGAGGGLHLVNARAVLDQVVIEANYSGNGGGLSARDSYVSLFHTLIIDNFSANLGGGLYVVGGALALTNVLITSNSTGCPGGGAGGALYASGAGVSLTNVTITNNGAYYDAGGILVTGGTYAELRNVILTDNDVNYEVGGLWASDSSTVVVSYTDAWGNTSFDEDWTVVTSNYEGLEDPTGTDGNVSIDPDFLDDSYRLAEGSPLVDAGDPDLLDPDGTRSDMGAWGGPEADRWDLDGDGYPVGWLPGGSDASALDCDDREADIYQGRAEDCDGMDNDCDGVVPAEEADDDGDGQRVCESDCDDTSRVALSGAVEICDDGADNDCDGAIDDAGCYARVCDALVSTPGGSIQAAIDVASDGDTICVAPGTYTENLDFGGAEVSVIGLDGPSATILDGGDAGSVVEFASGEGSSTLLQGFTLTNGGSYLYGGGVRISGSDPTLVDLVVEDNHADDYGGGIYVEDGAPTLTNVVLRENSAGYGGGLALVDLSDVVLENVSIEDSHATSSGGGLYVESSEVSLTHVAITGNKTGDAGAGLYLTSWSTVQLTNVLVTDNQASSGTGGGLYAYKSRLTLTNVTLCDNDSELSGGGLTLSSGPPRATLDNVIVCSNVANMDDGGGVYVEEGTTEVAYTDAWGNEPDDYSGLTDPTGTDGNLSVDPDFLGGYHLAGTSPLIDAGDPILFDPDGSSSDPGAFGGPGAAGWDLDGDGYNSWWIPGAYDAITSPELDCDDQDASVYPGSGC